VARLTMCALVLLCCAAATALVPTSAFAVDGVVLINQNSVTTGLGGCDAPGFPLTLCHAGSYRLSGNLSVGSVNTTAIQITANNITLDLNGFTISGPVVCTPGSYPVPCTGHWNGVGINSAKNNITVRNGTVRGMGLAGINFTGLGALVEDVHAESNAGVNSAAISVLDGIVTHCTVGTNAGTGISAGAFDSTVSFNNVIFNGGFGILGGAMVSNNNASLNGSDGINNAANILYNTLHRNGGFAISLSSFTFAFSGYMGNVMIDNVKGNASGGHSMGNNLCNGSAC
jgi:hypothetical protein